MDIKPSTFDIKQYCFWNATKQKIQYFDNLMHQLLLLSFPLFIYQSIFYDPISMIVVVSISGTKRWHGVTQCITLKLNSDLIPYTLHSVW